LMDSGKHSGESELERRQRASSTTVNVLLILTLMAIFLGYFTVNRDFAFRGSAWTVGATRIAILFLAVGAIVLRRTRFQVARLQDIVSLRGSSGLISTLQNTTLEVAGFAFAITLLGFIGTLLSGDFLEVLRAGIIALVLLFYAYPRKAAWKRLVQGLNTFDGEAAVEAKRANV